MRSKAFYKELLARINRVHPDISSIISDLYNAAEAVNLLANREDYFCTEYVTKYAMRYGKDFADREVKRAITRRITDDLLDSGMIQITREYVTECGEPMIKFTGRLTVLRDMDMEDTDENRSD